MSKVTKEQVEEIARKHGYEPEAVHAVLEVESNGKGFSDTTSKIIIQFEPSWFMRIADPVSRKRGKIWSANKVDNQPNEWLAFNEAFGINKSAAMQSTSIGMFQIMGFHYRALGFATVDEMWNYAKVSEANQLEMGIRFINSNARLRKALKARDWKTFAYHYNGSQYQKFNYDNRLASAYRKYDPQYV